VRSPARVPWPSIAGAFEVEHAVPPYELWMLPLARFLQLAGFGFKADIHKIYIYLFKALHLIIKLKIIFHVRIPLLYQV